MQVETAQSGTKALAAIETDPPDIVLLDLMMPEMDGFEVCERIKNNLETTHIPVMMVTAFSDLTDLVRGLEAGADNFLTKPVDDHGLFARVWSLVRLNMLMEEGRLRERASESLTLLDGNTIAKRRLAPMHKSLSSEIRNSMRAIDGDAGRWRARERRGGTTGGKHRSSVEERSRHDLDRTLP